MNKNSKQKKGLIIGLSIATGAFCLTSVGLGITNAIQMNSLQGYQEELESVYQKNMFDLAEGVNNAEIKLSKVINSNDGDFQRKMLTEVVQNATLAESSIANLPITQNSMAESVKFINELKGYSSTVVENLSEESKISEKERENLIKLHTSLSQVKEILNEYMDKLHKGYSIVKDEVIIKDENNSFTTKLSMFKEISVDYPTMIYDGPFSESQQNYVVRGLKGEVVDRSEAYNSVTRSFKNIASLEFNGEIDSNFQTYNFDLTTTSEHNLFVQVSKIGGHILTVSGYNKNTTGNEIEMEDAQKIALDFVKVNGIENAECVWEDKLNSEAYFNIAPKQDGIILYPDLIKVKVDLLTGTIIGYDATSYFISHVERNLQSDYIGVENAKNYLPAGFISQNGRLVLAPLEYSREIVCYEFESFKDDEVYYFYINACSGKLENVLKVISTNNGAKLM